VSSFATPGVTLDDLRGARVIVWGAGREGRAAVDVIGRHVDVASLTVIVDDATPHDALALGGDAEVPILSTTTGAGRTAVLDADVIVKSPGVSPYVVPFAELSRGTTVTGGTALWFAHTGGRASIGITGSKGKSTTSSLVHHLLTALGERSVLAGNIGRAPIEVLGEVLDAEQRGRMAGAGDASTRPDRWVFELSSFQSAEVDRSPELGVLTSLFPEHLNWHGTVERYYADKANLFVHGTVVLAANLANADVDRLVGRHPATRGFGLSGAVRSTDRCVLDADGSVLVDLADSRLVGAHNASNVAAALAVLRAAGHDITKHADDLRAALRAFEPLAHRLQPVGSIDGRLIVDDSLSTAPQAAVAALDAYRDAPVAIIVGGFDRGLDYAPLADACAARTAPTWVLGVPQSGERLIPLIDAAVRAAGADHVQVEGFDDFDAAVARASDVTPAHGVILLSPGAPSFGRFTDYVERGMHFRRLLGLEPAPAHVEPVSAPGVRSG
jgi:UDP-N-acetylmuramoyl-L-alanine---L-glutamate ligase